MSANMDVHRLIAEVKQRPALWDVRLSEYKDRASSALLWREIADNVGCDVELCKRKWKNLRDAYRAEVRRTERRVQRLKLEGHEDPQVSDSKWAFFKPMSFMSEIKRKRYSTPTAISHDFSSDSHEAYNAEANTDDHIDMEDYCQVKMEHSTDEEADYKTYKRSPKKLSHDCPTVPEDDDEANELLFEQFKSVATPQAARRLSGTLTFVGSLATTDESPTSTAAASATAIAVAPIPAVASTTDATIVSNSNGNLTTNNPNCKCTQREDQVHFLEDLEREEQKLMQSTRRDITRANANSLSHLGDSDYNFLVSFLPQMKRLNDLQNLQFRAKMSELMLCIMAQPAATTATATTSPLLQPATTIGYISTTTPTLQRHNFSSNIVQHHQQEQQQQQQHEQQHHFNEASTTTANIPQQTHETHEQQSE